MVCQNCVADGAASVVYAPLVTVTGLPVVAYWDAGDVWHSHDPNARLARYECSLGHTWQVRERVPCPAPACPFNEGLGPLVPAQPG